ncbi:hypothetical protein [Lunatibacter salilacus]|uniref:hypothetical protein n=1 Tax=Lunatibacter salilacus TaxID=2483804 RepID=UPI00131CF545|nr:hypothetical protein [Lunatibacter salilacus]
MKFPSSQEAAPIDMTYWVCYRMPQTLQIRHDQKTYAGCQKQVVANNLPIG